MEHNRSLPDKHGFTEITDEGVHVLIEFQVTGVAIQPFCYTRGLSTRTYFI